MINLKSLLSEIVFGERKFSHGNKENPIGPHNKNEFELMISGKKPAALVDPADYNKFRPYVSSGKFYSTRFTFNDGTMVYIISLQSEKWRASRIKKLFQWKEKIKRGKRDVVLGDLVNTKTLKMYHIKLGVLLGYSKEDINSFLKNINI